MDVRRARRRKASESRAPHEKQRSVSLDPLFFFSFGGLHCRYRITDGMMDGPRLSAMDCLGSKLGCVRFMYSAATRRGGGGWWLHDVEIFYEILFAFGKVLVFLETGQKICWSCGVLQIYEGVIMHA